MSGQVDFRVIILLLLSEVHQGNLNESALIMTSFSQVRSLECTVANHRRTRSFTARCGCHSRACHQPQEPILHVSSKRLRRLVHS